MRSPVRRPAREALEWALRIAALAMLAVALWRLFAPARTADAGARAARGSGAGVAAALAEWTADSAARDLDVAFDSLPSPRERDWLAALAGAGRRVRWSTGALPVAVATEAAVRPEGGVLVRVASAATAASVADAGGALDSAPTAAGPAALALRGAAGPIAARVRGATARADVAAAPALRRVLVLGRAGWEAKFVVAALEEAGWSVDAREPVAPGVVVTQGAAVAPDTARLAAVVALDSSAAASAGAIRRFVGEGGGLVLAGEAAVSPAFAALAAGVAGPESAGEAAAIAGARPRTALTLRPVLRARADAVPVERRGALVAAAARRVGAGRVLQLGYADSWRWRMEGDDDAPAAHRAWWSGAVASVAFAPAPPPSAAPAPDGAPYATTVAALGPPVPSLGSASAPATPARDALPPWLLPLSAAALLAEWASRRLRGAR